MVLLRLENLPCFECYFFVSGYLRGDWHLLDQITCLTLCGMSTSDMKKHTRHGHILQWFTRGYWRIPSNSWTAILTGYYSFP